KTTEPAPESERVIARLEVENAYLRQFLKSELEARRPADHLLAGADGAVPAYPIARSSICLDACGDDPT
ncbi:MAG TPA: hypothetical protein VFI22_15620, partial [Thermomicrobiales bacterium]|nr:hypothetical protein [Thermomicrobiales bacterium]